MHMIWASVTTAMCLRKDLVIIEKAMSVALMLINHQVLYIFPCCSECWIWCSRLYLQAAVDYLRTKLANECVLQTLMQLPLADTSIPPEFILLLSQVAYVLHLCFALVRWL